MPLAWLTVGRQCPWLGRLSAASALGLVDCRPPVPLAWSTVGRQCPRLGRLSAASALGLVDCRPPVPLAWSTVGRQCPRLGPLSAASALGLVDWRDLKSTKLMEVFFFGVERRIPSRDSATAGRSSKAENNHCQSKPCKLDYIILMYFNRVKVFQLSYKCIRDTTNLFVAYPVF